MAAEEEKDDDNNVVASITTSFTELAVVEQLIVDLKSPQPLDVLQLESSRDNLKDILDRYQEQPHLLDPHLDSILSQLLTLVRDHSTVPQHVHQSFKYLSLFTKVRGYKVIVRHLPHEVSDLELVLALLTKQDPHDSETWETRYILLLWLSIVVIIPFHLSRLDAGDGHHHHRVPIAKRIMDLAIIYLSVSDKSRDAAAYLIAKFVTRPDASDTLLPEFIVFALETLENWNNADSNTGGSMASIIGAMLSLALVFKHGKRDSLSVWAKRVLIKIPFIGSIGHNETVLRKLTMKLEQRIGLVFLKPRIAQWRYQRGSRSLASNLMSGPVSSSSERNEKFEQDEDQDYDVPDEIEEVIEQLLMGLGDRDTVVRWSAAKGIGRLTSRLPKEMADDVVGSVLEKFTVRENDNAWHGGCLALAELGRRGLLLPTRLVDVVPIILRALVYDEQKGNFSVGSHIRDAACYVCWAFARAYDASEMAPYVNSIAGALLVTTVFDREVNCRRAASAAFQENVGRQGKFPHGIDILTTADYHAVAMRANCYLSLSVYIAQFPEYTLPLIDHLVDRKVGHWDPSIRDLTAQALHKLTPAGHDHTVKNVLPRLLPLATGIDLQARHGSVLAIGEIVHALSVLSESKGQKVVQIIGEEVYSFLKNLIPTLEKRKLFKGLGGELMRQASARLIKKLSQSHLPLDEDIITCWQRLLDDNLTHVSSTVQSMTADSLDSFYNEYYGKRENTKVVESYITNLKSPSLSIRMGFALALGNLPKLMINGHVRKVLEGLIECASLEHYDAQKLTESRRDALTAATKICQTVGLSKGGDKNVVVEETNFALVVNGFLRAMGDYTLDNRGDIGACVREAAMTGLDVVTNLASSSYDSCDDVFLPPAMVVDIVSKVVQQCVEKIDRTRSHACRVFMSLIHRDPRLPNIARHDEILQIFPREECAQLNWSAPANTFPKFARLLVYPEYTYRVLLGLVVSVGGLTESLVKHSSESLFEYLRSVNENDLESERVGSSLLQIFVDYRGDNRVMIPMLNTIAALLSVEVISDMIHRESSDFSSRVFDLVKTEAVNNRDPIKLIAAASVFCGLIQAHDAVRRRALAQSAIFLCHRYPRVRKATANKLYESLLIYDDILAEQVATRDEINAEETQEEILGILLETDWDQPVDVLRPIRNKFCQLLNIPTPTAVSAKQTTPVT